MSRNGIFSNIISYIFLTLAAILFLSPVFIVLMNSFKSKFHISDSPFSFPDSNTFEGIRNYTDGVAKTGFFKAFGWSLFITVFSVAAIVFFTSMTAWYITRRKTKFTSALYYAFVFSMIVPFQMVMFTLSKTADTLKLNTPWTIPVIYLGFGAGLAVFMFTGFVKSIPLSIEEAAKAMGITYSAFKFNMLRPLREICKKFGFEPKSSKHSETR